MVDLSYKKEIWKVFKLKRQIIVVPGIMGSVLQNKSVKVWPRKVVDLPLLDYYEQYLTLNEDNDGDHFRAVSVLGLTYGKIIGDLKEKGYIVSELFYDWRKNNLTQIERFEQEILDADADEITIIAHSMGGIITKLFLNSDLSDKWRGKIKRIITLGTPWLGSLDAYKTLNFGKSIPEDGIFQGIVITDKASKFISPSFPSVFQLLPNEEYFKKALIQDEPILVFRNDRTNIYSSEEAFDELILPIFDMYHHDYQEVIEDFHKALIKPLDIEHHEVIGVGSFTLAGIEENELNEHLGDFRNGDGTVTIFSAMSENSYKYFVPKVKHHALPNNRCVIELISKILNEDEVTENEEIILSVEKVKETGFTGKVVRIACPVMVNILDDNGNSIYGHIEAIDEQSFEGILYDQKAQVYTIGKTIYVLYEEYQYENKEQKLIIEAYAEGPTSIAVENFKNGRMKESGSGSFKTFNINLNKTVELVISEVTADVKAIIKENEHIEELELKPIQARNTVELIFPKTKYRLSFEQGVFREDKDIYLCTGRSYLYLEEVCRGSFDIDNTFYSINGEKFNIMTFEETELMLKPGMNKILIYSRDIQGNTEDYNELSIFYLKELEPVVEFEFYTHQFKVKVKPNRYYFILNHQYGIELPEITMRFDNDNDVYGEDIIYNNLERIMTITYDTLLGDLKKESEYKIIEKDIISVFEGTIEESKIHEVLFNLHLDEDIYCRITKRLGGRPYTTINERNIKNFKNIILRGISTSAVFYNNIDYTVSFHNLDEDFTIPNSQESYSFYFKVFDKVGVERKTLNLSALLYIKNRSESLFDEAEIVFNETTNVYEGSFSIKFIEETVKEFQSNEIQNLELHIVDSDHNTVLRIQQIKVRYIHK
ncbi:hypothetical protein [Paenibacillus sp. RC67]|uniref:lipase/acyltransferase domain-containing protein n=1 Tax=Paenibacillus sp. RC67 TaxID=3039392 RepID=UPI0024ACFB58|nr:hypothetical protein [Paenibacillus sp. RC67]